MKTDQPWSAIARPSVWSGHRSVPQIVASIGEEHAGQIVSPLDVLSRVRGAKREESVMENIFLCCAGLDIHKESVEACVRRMEPGGRLHRQTRHWATMSRDILLMADWMAAQGVTHVAMESTGVFWKPIFNILVYRILNVFTNRGDRCILAICPFHRRPNCPSRTQIASSYWRLAVIAAHLEVLFSASILSLARPKE